MADLEFGKELTMPRKAVVNLAIRRFGARCFDYICFGAILQALGAPKELSWYLLYWAVWIPFEALSLALFGTTLGKYLFDLHLIWKAPKAALGERFLSSGRRAAEVWILGVGCGIPLVSIVAMAFGFSRLWERGTERWDDDVGTTVVVSSASRWAKLIIAIVVIVALAGLQ